MSLEYKEKGEMLDLSKYDKDTGIMVFCYHIDGAHKVVEMKISQLLNKNTIDIFNDEFSELFVLLDGTVYTHHTGTSWMEVPRYTIK